MLKLDAKAFALACGILWGGWVFILGWSASVCPWAYGYVDWLSPFYIGYDNNFVGGLIGGVWGFFDAGIGGFLLAWLYNKLSKA